MSFTRATAIGILLTTADVALEPNDAEYEITCHDRDGTAGDHQPGADGSQEPNRRVSCQRRIVVSSSMH